MEKTQKVTFTLRFQFAKVGRVHNAMILVQDKRKKGEEYNMFGVSKEIIRHFEDHNKIQVLSKSQECVNVHNRLSSALIDFGFEPLVMVNDKREYNIKKFVQYYYDKSVWLVRDEYRVLEKKE